jgi:anti-sigma factor RsiW
MGEWAARKEGFDMDCRAVQEKLVAFLDGELSIDPQDAIEVHLSRCGECRMELKALQELNTAMDLLPGLPVPAGFSRETVKRAISLERQGTGIEGWWRSLGHAWRLAACAAALIGVLSGGMVSRSALTPDEAVNGDEILLSYLDEESSIDEAYGQAVSGEQSDQDETW